MSSSLNQVQGSSSQSSIPTLNTLPPQNFFPAAFPQEILIHIFTQLGKRDIGSLSACNKKLYEVSSQPTLWEILIKQDFPLFSTKAIEGEDLKKEYKRLAALNKAAEELVKAVNAGYLTAEEAVPGIPFQNSGEQTNAVGNKRIADEKLQAFYATFKTWLTHLGINEGSPDFGTYVGTAVKLIEKQGEEMRKHDPVRSANLAIKLKTTYQEFNSKIFEDMIDGYANLPIESITIDNFKAKVALFMGVFPYVDYVSIESALRRAIKSKHGSAEFDTMRGRYSDQNPNNPKVAEIKVALHAKFTAEKAALEAELAKMLGANGFNGINEATLTRFNQIVVYVNGQPTGGRLAQVNANLSSVALEMAARAQAHKIAYFYRELSMIVGDHDQPAARSQALHAIIGN